MIEGRRARARVKRRSPQDDLDILSLAQFCRHHCGCGWLGQPSVIVLDLQKFIVDFLEMSNPATGSALSEVA
jgi:hypothetical protein